MSVHLCFLRAVNVSGNNLVKMAALKDALVRAGLGDVRTILQSGNVVFRSDDNEDALARLIGSVLRNAFNLSVGLFLRTPQQVRQAMERNPFKAAANESPKHLLVTFLSAPPDTAAVAALKSAIPGDEAVAVSGREAFIHYAGGVARSKVTNVFVEKRLGVTGTARNWNTVGRVLAVADELAMLPR